MDTELPLTALLSQVLVAFTIEFDNEAEQLIHHRTTRTTAGGTGRGPWLVSLAMWANFLRYVTEKGVRLGDIAGRAGITNLAGMERWRYVTVGPDPGDGRAKAPRRDWLVRTTLHGRRALAVWEPLAAVVEARWHARGEGEVDRLRAQLQLVVDQLEPGLPDFMPVVKIDLAARLPDLGSLPARGRTEESPAELFTLLSRVLLAFTAEVESEAPVAMPVGANLLRVLSEAPVPGRDLPRRTGVSKEALSMMQGFLLRRGMVVVDRHRDDPRTKVVGLTPKGIQARDRYVERVRVVEGAWKVRFGSGPVSALRATLEALVGEGTLPSSPLQQAIEPPPGGWRATVRRPETLPHYPMVLHRGGYPDGS